MYRRNTAFCNISVLNLETNSLSFSDLIVIPVWVTRLFVLIEYTENN